MDMQNQLKRYMLVTFFSALFALTGFGYNVWRMEKTESNSNIREASFELLQQLADIELLIYSIHYDHSQSEGTPRKGWVKVDLVNDMSGLVGPQVKVSAQQLRNVWQAQWNNLESNDQAAEAVTEAIEQVRKETRAVLASLH